VACIGITSEAIIPAMTYALSPCSVTQDPRALLSDEEANMGMRGRESPQTSDQTMVSALSSDAMQADRGLVV
jgi:hypothetical protein